MGPWKIRKEVPEDLGTQAKNKKMKKINILFLISFTVLFACKTVEKTVAEPEISIEDTEEIKETTSKDKEFQYLFVEALKEKMIGNPQRAIALLSSCLEIDPNSAVAMYELANIHALNNDVTSAALLLDKAISINPDNKWYKLLLARIYQQSKRFEDASKIYSQLLEKEPENLDYLYLNAIMLSNADKPAEAIKAYEKLEEKTGLNEQISVSKQQLYLESGKVKEAFEEIYKLIESDPEESQYYGLLADLYMNQGDKENALKNYNKILEMDPTSGYVHFSLSNYYMKQGDKAKAYEEIILGFTNTNVELDTKLQLYLMLSAPDSPEKYTETEILGLINILITTHPDDFRVYTIYAEYLLQKQELSEARVQLKKVLELNPDDYMIWERVLFIDNDLLEWEALYEDSKNAMELFPNQPQVYFLNGVACVQLEKFDETLEICEEGLGYVVDNPPLQGQFILLQAEAKYKLSQFTESFELFEKAIELNPENYIAMNNYAYYLSLNGTKLDVAERMSGRVVDVFPTNATYLDTHAWVLFKKKKYQLAKFYMETALSNGGKDNPTLLEHYGDILFMLEKLDEARDYWQKAKDNGNESTVLERKIKDQTYYEK